MESPNSMYNSNNINGTAKDGFEANTSPENLIIPSNFLLSTKEIIARFPHNKRVGHYLLGRKLGEGSFAKVKEGLHTLTGQKVAIKVIDKKKAKEDAYVSKNMRREGKLLQMIIHPNIIQLYELMETENSYYLVTELCEGGDLMDYICARKYLSEACTRKFIRQIISAVDYLHRIGILHRDLKIENLLLDKNLNIKLIDFGLSNYTKSELCITQCGSPAYAAPELLAHKKYGSKVDVWSIGVNMYAMLTGNLPFTVEPFNIKSLYNKMMKNEMNPIPEHLSKSGEDLLKKLLNPDPIKRISLKEAMEHPWLNEGYANLLKPFPYPNKPTEDQVNPTILRYMNSNMDFNLNEITENIKLNKPSSSLATYYLLLNKVKTMLMKIDPKKEKQKTRSDPKPAIKDLKQSSPTKPFASNTSAGHQPTAHQQILPIIANTGSPLSRTNSKTPGSSNISRAVSLKPEHTTPIPKFTAPRAERAGSPLTELPGHYSGAIKNLTQKYKTMHLATSVDANIFNNGPAIHHTAPSTPASLATHNSVNLGHTFKSNYLNQSIEPAFLVKNDALNSEADEKHRTGSSINRSVSNTPAYRPNAEWTQFIKLNNQKNKSDMNNNELNGATQANNEDASPIHLNSTASNNASTGSSLHMPIIAYNNSNSSTNTSNVGPKSARSPVVKKLASPINLPSIDTSMGRNTP
ncbi:serine threonine- kinase MARK2-like isoform X1 [Brachionus plicatilis]|uniref:non-specific serine/threonine protein kinase n=1 Tax=Brachionus plicatilis TaxID=10195 RepID=A0A3M7QLI7_BRAPC|nr:serine threonine- kinase MARK2-like isoform X1 [Brachionus plicatilis]